MGPSVKSTKSVPMPAPKRSKLETFAGVCVGVTLLVLSVTLTVTVATLTSSGC